MMKFLKENTAGGAMRFIQLVLVLFWAQEHSSLCQMLLKALSGKLEAMYEHPKVVPPKLNLNSPLLLLTKFTLSTQNNNKK